MTDAWVVERRRAGAAELHAWQPGDRPGRRLVVMEATGPALVLGSTQPETDVDHAAAVAAGTEVVRRRSGGGAVLVEPAGLVWVDAVVPRDDPLWHDDVGRAFEWFGEAWVRALRAVAGALTASRVEVHRGPLVRSALSPVVCFAGLGPGEVTLDGDKVVGISQRRTRGWARFQSSLLLRWDPDRHARLLAPGIGRALAGAGSGATDGAAAIRALPVRALEVGPDAALEALVAELPDG